MWSDTPCKIWDGAKNSDGYPTVRHNGKMVLLTRLILEEKQGRLIKDGYECCHYCDDPRCTEKEHLWEGTHAENMRDAHRKGRGRTHGPGNLGHRRTYCPQGHEYTKENTGIYNFAQYCKECKRVKAREYQAKRRAANR